jgi:hypothetical protein
MIITGLGRGRRAIYCAWPLTTCDVLLLPKLAYAPWADIASEVAEGPCRWVGTGPNIIGYYCLVMTHLARTN